MASMLRSIRRQRRRSSPPATTTPTTKRPAVQVVPADPPKEFTYDGETVTVVCTRCHHIQETGDLMTIVECSHGPLPLELPEENFTRRDGRLVFTLAQGQTVPGYCERCTQRTRMDLLTEQEGDIAEAKGLITLDLGEEWDDQE